jgi:hypothetical protein
MMWIRILLHFDAVGDPDPAYNFNTDPDPDPTFQFDADSSRSGSTTMVGRTCDEHSIITVMRHIVLLSSV